jgi:anti-sigma factor ChrR (cupin superfamily)
MPAHLQLTEEIAESAALYALGLLSDIERSSIDRHLQEGCSICQAEISRCGDLLVAWARESPVSPPSSLRQKLLQSLHKAAASSATSTSPVLFDRAGLTLIRTPRMDWNPGPTPGLWIKVLVEDAENDMSTMLIRMGAGSFYPSHRHKGIEEVYVLEGGLRVEGMELTAGDFCVSRPETVHQSTYSEFGCLLMVKSSKHDEVLA